MIRAWETKREVSEFGWDVFFAPLSTKKVRRTEIMSTNNFSHLITTYDKKKQRLNAVKSQTPSLYHLPCIFLERSRGHIFWFWAARNEVFAFKKKSQPIEPKYQVEKDVAFANPETLLPRIGAPWRVMRFQVTPKCFFSHAKQVDSFSFKLVVLGILMNHFLPASGATRQPSTKNGEQRKEKSWSRSIQSWKYALNLSGGF